MQALRRETLVEALGAERTAAARADVQALGLFGALLALCAPGAPEPAVRDELPTALRRDLADATGGAPEAPLGELLERYRAAKGLHAPELLRRLVARVVHELYDLSAHRLVQEDVLAACELLAAGGPRRDARETARCLARISRNAARTVLGHLDQQLEFVHALGQGTGELPLAEIDRRLAEYAPRLFAQRLPSMLKRLLGDEPRLRLAFVVWGRLRGLTFGRAAIQGIAPHVVPERPEALAEAVVAQTPALAALRAADAAAPDARRIEDVFLPS